MKQFKLNENQSNDIFRSLHCVRKRFIYICLLCILVIIGIGGFLSARTMQQSTQIAYQSASTQISQRIDESLKLLKSLASLPEFNDPKIPWEDKVKKLDTINKKFGYMFICYVDKDIQVYTLGEKPASLAGRTHMQKLYSTQKDIVTDSFVAGADGVTLNYTVAVPLKKGSKMTGSLFCSIYFDETIKLLNKAVSMNGVDAVLVGSKGQVMSSTNDMSYGSSYMDILLEEKLIDVTADKLETSLLARKSGSFLSIKSGNVQYTTYGPINNTNWDVLVTSDFLSNFLAIVPYQLLLCFLITVILTVLYRYTAKQIKKQAESNKKILASFHEIEKKLYHSDEVQTVDYENILQMSSKGLKDDLTGLATRVFFLNQARQIIDSESDGKILTLCFVDLDDLKIINDTHGHVLGDIALKKIGTVLREYEKMYDGFAGRYGGDEFILLLKDLEDTTEVKDVLKKLVGDLRLPVSKDGIKIPIHCSIGACICDKNSSLDTIISNADKALYDVKRHGKGDFSLFSNGEQEYEERN